MPALSSQQPAVVSRAPAQPWGFTDYLLVAAEGPCWTPDPRTATAFTSMKEAARAAVRLPSSMRAFGLPLRAEVNALGDLH